MKSNGLLFRWTCESTRTNIYALLCIDQNLDGSIIESKMQEDEGKRRRKKEEKTLYERRVSICGREFEGAISYGNAYAKKLLYSLSVYVNIYSKETKKIGYEA